VLHCALAHRKLMRAPGEQSKIFLSMYQVPLNTQQFTFTRCVPECCRLSMELLLRVTRGAFLPVHRSVL
jgi:hypothetical protein